MENAAKALKIAGGVLLAMLLTSLLIFVFRQISSFSKVQEEQLEAKQLAEFNQQWEAYNKKLLYGTDVITVVNKAIDNNNKMETQDSENAYFVNVTLELNQSFLTNVVEYDNKTTQKKTLEVSSQKYDQLIGEMPLGFDIEEGTTYAIGKYKKNGAFVEAPNVVEIFEDSNMKKGQTQVIEEERYTYYVYPPLTDFKLAVFECTGIEYNDYGRVTQINFRQKQGATY